MSMSADKTQLMPLTWDYGTVLLDLRFRVCNQISHSVASISHPKCTYSDLDYGRKVSCQSAVGVPMWPLVLGLRLPYRKTLRLSKMDASARVAS